MAVTPGVPADDRVPPEVVSSVFYSATVSEGLAILVAETVGGTPRVSRGNQGAVTLLGHAVEDLRCLPVEQLLPTLRGGELELLLRRERTAQTTLPVRTVSGATVEALVVATPAPTGRMWTLRVVSTANEAERALRARADAHERRFATLTERSPIPMLLSEQGRRLAHVNDSSGPRSSRASAWAGR